MKNKQVAFLINKKGFSIAELLISSAIVSSIALFSYDISRQVTKEISNIDERSDLVLDQTGVFKSVNDDILNSVPSFNFLKSQNVNKQSIDFWTIWDQDNGKEQKIEISKNNSCLSILTIDVTKKIDIVTTQVTRIKSLLPNPSFFYNPRKNINEALVYNVSKFNKLLKDNKLNANNQLLKLSGMMPVFDSGGYYKDYGIILKINSSGIAVVDNSIPTYIPPSVCSVKNIDTFLRCLPSPGGGVANFYITPLSYITYCLRTVSGNKGYSLFRKKNAEENLIATNLRHVKLVRTSSSNPLINIDIGFCELKSTDPICN